MTYRFSFAAASDRGLVRTNNEDSAFASSFLLALADGMGGHAAGEVASQIMIEHIAALDRDPANNDMLALLGMAADEANAAIAESIYQHPEQTGMGTTLTALLTNGTSVAMCHVGDSRGYRLRDGELEQITVDDTLVQSMVDKGELAPEDVSTHPKRSWLLKAYTGVPVTPTLKLLDARPGDRFLLCSDGLSDPVTAATIESTLGAGTPAEAAANLIQLALRSGGPDNVTLVVADVVTASGPAPQEPPALAVGALLGDVPDGERDDTSAARAAQLLVRREHVPVANGQAPAPAGGHGAAGAGHGAAASGAGLGASHPGHSGGTGQTPGAPAGAGDPSDLPAPSVQSAAGFGGRRPARRDRTGIIALGVSLAVVAVLALGAWFGYQHSQSRYYVTVRDGLIQLEKGVPYTVFGRSLHSPYQDTCLTPAGDVRLVGLGEQVEGCTPFHLDDLAATSRNSVDALESGDYDTAAQSLRRLAEHALPVCVEREEGDDGPGNLSDPGVDCREVER